MASVPRMAAWWMNDFTIRIYEITVVDSTAKIVKSASLTRA